MYGLAVAESQRLVEQFPSRPDYRFSLAIDYDGLGSVLLKMPGRQQDADTALKKALALLKKLDAESPGQPRYLCTLAGTYMNLGLLQAARAG